MVALLCASIASIALLTVGRAAAAEAQVQSRMEAAGSRVLVVVDERDTGLVKPSTVQILNTIDLVDRAVGFGSPVDVTNTILGSGGTRVPAWTVVGPWSAAVTLTAGREPGPGEAIVSEVARLRLGLAYPVGVVSDSSGRQYPVVGSYRPRDPFDQLETGVVINHDGPESARSLHVVATSAAATRAVEVAVLTTLAPTDSRDVSVQSPLGLAELQRAVGGDLTAYGRGLLLLMMGGGAFLIAAVVFAEVLLRRRDLGRRRALGVSRSGLVAMVVARTVIAAIPGVLFGATLGAGVATYWAQRPPLDFVAAVVMLTLLTASVAAAPPALLAAWRDPVGVLRTP
ncbi:FtsX-like permease family protein [Micromonospora gifhornensis]|uniref:FtsX-like permease family protein n=1 Tax=Micromonospora gifhornensis TaxID=84594 RepID=UPI003D75E156